MWAVFLPVFTALSSSSLTIFIFSNWVTSAHQQHNALFYIQTYPKKTRAPEPIWLHLPLTLTHTHTHPPSTSVPVVITPACPPVDCFLWVLQQHRTGYKSHCIIAAPRFASRFARPVRACDWAVRFLGRPLRAGHRCNRKSRLLPWDRWLGKGLSLNCQSCSFLCVSHPVLFPATRWVRSDETRCIPTETYGSRLIKAEVETWRLIGTHRLVSDKKKNIYVKSLDSFYFIISKIYSLSFKAPRAKLSIWDICFFFLLWYFSGWEILPHRRQTTPLHLSPTS